PITGVVGPNGCGKSNIVDAIRWCMGEQSAKHLRGKAMDDVIFNGSDSRGPASMAEVSLTFEDVGFSEETLRLALSEQDSAATPAGEPEAPSVAAAAVGSSEDAVAAAAVGSSEDAVAAAAVGSSEDAVAAAAVGSSEDAVAAVV